MEFVLLHTERELMRTNFVTCLSVVSGFAIGTWTRHDLRSLESYDLGLALVLLVMIGIKPSWVSDKLKVEWWCPPLLRLICPLFTVTLVVWWWRDRWRNLECTPLFWQTVLIVCCSEKHMVSRYKHTHNKRAGVVHCMLERISRSHRQVKHWMLVTM